VCEHYGSLSHDGHEAHITCTVIHNNYDFLPSEGIFRHHHNLCPEEIKKRTQNSENSFLLDDELNPRPPECEGVLGDML
jgi:hypothetical protein